MTLARREWQFRLYRLLFGLLVLHEIDSAFWQEWRLFHLPGGSQLFVFLHLPLLYLGAWGADAVRRGTLGGTWSSLLLAAAGVLGFVLHAAFLAAGDPAFRAPLSVALILVLPLGSLLLLGATLAVLREEARRPSLRKERPQ